MGGGLGLKLGRDQGSIRFWGQRETGRMGGARVKKTKILRF